MAGPEAQKSKSPPHAAESSSAGPQVNREREAFRVRDLEPEPPGVSYDPDLERLCRVAASVGGKQEEGKQEIQPAPLSYTALVIAFLFGEDPVSRWFQSYVQGRSIDLVAIYTSKGTNVQEREFHMSRAASGALPIVTPLYSRSVKNVMQQAARIAGEISKHPLSVPTLGARHVMAAYAFRNPSDHRDQVRGWGFDEKDWQEQFFAFAQQTYPEEEWARLKGFERPFVETISSFTSDDPLAPPRDLLGVEDEAKAFARIAAAESIKPPLAIGIFGEWGSGKTFFMRRIYENVKTLTKRAAERAATGSGKSPFHADIVQIRFNAWHYIETNLWASLVEYIFGELDRWLLEKTQNERPKADLVFNRLATAQQLKLDALEDVITRRAERRSAELRAERARREYEEALARSAAVGGKTYARALLDTLLGEKDVKADLTKIGEAVGAPEITENAGRVMDLLEEARSEAGRTRLMVRAGVAKLGTLRWILAVAFCLVGIPLALVALKAVITWEPIKSIHETVVALAGLAASLAACGGALLRKASAALNQIDKFDKALGERVAKRVEQVQRSDVAKGKLAAEDEVKKRQQAMEAAERALAEADQRLTAARQDFESATARNRLNAFIRAKATEGDYAKHLGIIAAIRRDFGQLAALMGAANDTGEQAVERRRLAEEARTRVEKFLGWLQKEPEVRLTPGELRSLLSLLDQDQLRALVESDWRTVLTEHMEGADTDLDGLVSELQEASSELPKFSRIILYIDDLDRCPPATVVAVLQAVHLLLSFPLFTVIVAVDARWVSRALRKEYPNLLAEPGTFAAKNGEESAGAGASSHDYLEKIFQIPYWVRPIEPEKAVTYVNDLVKADVRRIANVPPSETAAGTLKQADSAGTQVTTPTSVHTESRGEASSTDSPEEPEHEASSLELTQWESDALEKFAPLVGATPRRLIRFVNVFRLIKTSLPPKLLERFVGKEGESDDYRALVAQLAIVTAAPDASLQYFAALEALPQKQPLAKVAEHLEKDTAFLASSDHAVVKRILANARNWYTSEPTIEHMLMTARLARRYSFTARPH